MKIDLEKILITGSEGMVGSYIDFGIKTDRHSLDVTNLNSVLSICQKNKPSAIVHLAAETDVDKCEREPEHAYLINSIGAYNVALVAKELGIKMVYISTAGVFDGIKKGPYIEEDEPNPQNYYGRSKHLGELAVKGVLNNFIIGRVCWMFGDGQEKDRKFVTKIIKQFYKGEVKVIDDQIGSPTFGKDLVFAIKKLILDDATGVYNLANKGYCSRYEFAKEIVKILKADVKIIPVKSVFFNLDAIRSNNESLMSKIDIMRPWQDALKEYLEMEWRLF